MMVRAPGLRAMCANPGCHNARKPAPPHAKSATARIEAKPKPGEPAANAMAHAQPRRVLSRASNSAAGPPASERPSVATAEISVLSSCARKRTRKVCPL